MSYIDTARRLRPIIEQAAQNLDDKTASEAAELFGTMRYDGALIKAGTIINHGGTLKRAANDLWDTEDCSPDSAPTLWSDIAYRNGVRVIPESMAAEQAFALGELGWQDGHIYRSLMDGNVYPVTQADAWEKVR